MAVKADFAKLDSIESRKSDGENLYLRLYQAKMAQNPSAHRFSDPGLDQKERDALTRWIRDCDDRTSPLNLQLLFAFSVPSREALDFIVGLKRQIISVGAGVGYWEFLLQQRGCDVLAFDSNQVYPEGLHYISVKTGGPEVLASHGDRALFLAWPDADVLHTQTQVRCPPEDPGPRTPPDPSERDSLVPTFAHPPTVNKHGGSGTLLRYRGCACGRCDDMSLDQYAPDLMIRCPENDSVNSQ
uniref:Uncharacterized protein n=1 Tax=Branchiostoma floridae TaxID=7739 RepID=C3XVV7_BRAFL|eukprot:XP_002611891.1 hypothetical protein BRAFLDRAFT_106811 [Branchiostoma floridae]